MSSHTVNLLYSAGRMGRGILLDVPLRTSTLRIQTGGSSDVKRRIELQIKNTLKLKGMNIAEVHVLKKIF